MRGVSDAVKARRRGDDAVKARGVKKAMRSTTLRRFYPDGSGEYVGNLVEKIVRDNGNVRYVVDMFHPDDPSRVYRETWRADDYNDARKLGRH